MQLGEKLTYTHLKDATFHVYDTQLMKCALFTLIRFLEKNNILRSSNCSRHFYPMQVYPELFVYVS